MSERSGDAVANALSAEAADHTRAVAVYANALPSRRALRRGRLLSSIGYLDTVTFGFVQPNASLISRGENRACSSIRLIAYGAAEDAALLKRTDIEGRARVSQLQGTNFVASRRVAEDDKTARLVSRLISSAGPAFHIVISRSGGVLVCASLDDVTNPETPLSIDIAYESAVCAPLDQWQAGQPNQLTELKFTQAQADSLSVTLAKVYAAYPGVSKDPVIVWFAGSGVTQLDFTASSWRENGPTEGAITPAQLADSLEAFDLGSEVFEVPGSSIPNINRATIAAAVTQADTLGQRSELLGDYARAAGSDRARAMRALTRREFYVQRVTSTQAQSAEAGAAASAAAATAPSGPRTVTNSGPWTYDFETGRWQDDNLSPY